MTTKYLLTFPPTGTTSRRICRSRCREESKAETIVFNLCGHGHFGMAAYTAYFEGDLRDHEYSDEELAMALSGLPSFNEG